MQQELLRNGALLRIPSGTNGGLAHLGGQHLEGEALQRVTGQDGGGLVEGAVAGRLAAAQVVVIHGRQVIVHQRVGVDQLYRRGRGIQRIEVSTERLAGGIHQRRAQAFATTECGIAHGGGELGDG